MFNFDIGGLIKRLVLVASAAIVAATIVGALVGFLILKPLTDQNRPRPEPVPPAPAPQPEELTDRLMGRIYSFRGGWSLQSSRGYYALDFSEAPNLETEARRLEDRTIVVTGRLTRIDRPGTFPSYTTVMRVRSIQDLPVVESQ